MLVRFSLSIASVETIGVDKIEMALTELLRAHRNGFHLLVFERGIAGYLIERIPLSNQDKAVLRRLHQEFTQNGRLHEQAAAYVEVTAPGPIVEKNGACISLPINLIDAKTFGTPSQLLSENANGDGKLITAILGWVRESRGTPKVNFEDAHGGGATIGERLIKALDEKRIGVCVLDTDKKHPNDEPCKVTKDALSAAERSEWSLFQVLALPCHEIENVIPFLRVCLLQSAAGCEWNTVIPRIERWERSGGKPEAESFWLFFDIKEGLSSEKLGLMNENQRDWIQQRLAVAGSFRGEWVYPAYGKKVVPLLLDSGLAMSDFRKLVRAVKWRSVFGEFFDKILWFGAAGAKFNT